jgi:hypothetical protein
LVFFEKAKKYVGDYDGYWLEIIGDEIITKKKKEIIGDDSMQCGCLTSVIEN